MNPLRGRELGIARRKLGAVVRVDPAAPITVREQVELALVWHVNGDGVAFPTIETLRLHIAQHGQRELHRSTVARALTRLPHFLTLGYFARNGFNPLGGALRGTAVRIVRPDIAKELGFPPLAEAVERLGMYRWLLPAETKTDRFRSASIATSGEKAQTRIPPLKSPDPGRHRKNATRRSLSSEKGDVENLGHENVPRTRTRTRESEAR